MKNSCFAAEESLLLTTLITEFLSSFVEAISEVIMSLLLISDLGSFGMSRFIGTEIVIVADGDLKSLEALRY